MTTAEAKAILEADRVMGEPETAELRQARDVVAAASLTALEAIVVNTTA